MERSVSPAEAEIWYIYEFEEDEAWSWRNAGFIPRIANEWREIGWTPEQAQILEPHMQPEESQEWKQEGFSAQEIIDFHVEAGLSVQQAKIEKGSEE